MQPNRGFAHPVKVSSVFGKEEEMTLLSYPFVSLSQVAKNMIYIYIYILYIYLYSIHIVYIFIIHSGVFHLLKGTFVLLAVLSYWTNDTVISLMLYILVRGYFKTRYPYNGHEVFQTSMDTVGPYSLD